MKFIPVSDNGSVLFNVTTAFAYWTTSVGFTYALLLLIMFMWFRLLLSPGSLSNIFILLGVFTDYLSG